MLKVIIIKKKDLTKWNTKIWNVVRNNKMVNYVPTNLNIKLSNFDFYLDQIQFNFPIYCYLYYNTYY